MRGNPPQNLFIPFLKQQPFTPKTAGDSETNVQNSLGNTPKNLLGEESHLRKEPQKTNVSFCPKNFAMAEDPRANTLRENANKS